MTVQVQVRHVHPPRRPLRSLILFMLFHAYSAVAVHFAATSLTWKLLTRASQHLDAIESQGGWEGHGLNILQRLRRCGRGLHGFAKVGVKPLTALEVHWNTCRDSRCTQRKSTDSLALRRATTRKLLTQTSLKRIRIRCLSRYFWARLGQPMPKLGHHDTSHRTACVQLLQEQCPRVIPAAKTPTCEATCDDYSRSMCFDSLIAWTCS